MILSESLNCLYIHIPKTGGTSMHAMMAPALDLNRDLDVRSTLLAHGNRGACGLDPETPLVKHSRIRRMRKLLGQEKLDALFTFTIVRNPFARAWSALTFKQQRALHHPEADVRARCAPYVDLTFDDIAADLPGYAAKMSSLAPQSDWVPKPAQLSYIARLETLEDDWTHLRAVLDITRYTSAIPRRENMTNKAPNWMRMSSKAAAAVADFYALDFKLFGYDPVLPTTEDV